MMKLISSAMLCMFLLANTGGPGPVKPDILAANIDNTVRPGDDFFQYANGGWLKKTVIPASESEWGIGELVQEDIYNKLKKINEDAVNSGAASGTITQKIGDFWKSGMDSAGIEKAGLSPLADEMQQIAAIKTPDDIIATGAAFQNKGIGCLFNQYVAQDDKNSEVMAVKMDQGGLGLPNKEYYFKTDERTSKVRQAYRDYLLAVFSRIDLNNAQKDADDVFALETRLAKSSRALEDLRDPYQNYNKMARKDLAGIAGNVNWQLYAKISKTDKVDSVIIGQPEFYTTFSNEIKNTPVEVWQNYLRMRLVNSAAPYLDSRTFNDRFTYTKTLNGATIPRMRWKRVLDAEEKAIGEALGQLFVKEYFNATAKKRYSDIVENIRTAYKERIQKLTWMSADTKKTAYDKLGKIIKKVGYPDHWKDFSALKIDNGPWVLNVQRANEWWNNYDIAKLGKPVDRTEWDMTPQTYNAYYNPSNNEIVLPAGIFAVPGFADAELDDALVYGYAAASTVGHEITHGFDDQGRQYDEKGNLQDWWTKKDADEFSSRAKMIIRQFGEFNPVDTLHINGDATQGENIADLGGVLLGLDAFKKTAAYKSNKKIGGFTPLQRYFLGYALSWLYTERKEKLANQVMTDVHSPARERINGPLVNVPEFYEAFNVKPGDKMYRPDSLRVHIW